MIKDVVVNLTGGQPQDFAADYAISVAARVRRAYRRRRLHL